MFKFCGIQVLSLTGIVWLIASCHNRGKEHSSGNDTISEMQFQIEKDTVSGEISGSIVDSASIKQMNSISPDTSMEIIHGSPEQAQLDSIKRAKLEIKKKMIN